MNYVPLWCKSNFSFLKGASHPSELVEQANDLDLPAIALTDRDGVYGAVEAYKTASDLSIDLIFGSEVTLSCGSTIILYAASKSGYANLCQLLSLGQRRTEKGKSSVFVEEICDRAGGLIALWDPLQKKADARSHRQLKDAFADRLYLLLARHWRPGDLEHEQQLRTFERKLKAPVVAVNEVLYHTPTRRPLQDILTCIDRGVCLDEAAEYLEPNGEHALKSGEQFSKLFRDCPEALKRTHEVASRCEFSLSEIDYQYPSEDCPDDKRPIQWLRELTYRGAKSRYSNTVPDAVRQQIEHELELIEDLGYSGYFLTMKDIVDYCEARDILCQGRGSAANSTVCYCLGITAIDPVRMKLLFERFISRERREPPDIDLDIEHNRREEVLQYVYDKYGRNRAAMVSNVIRYRPKSAIRDIGKTLGIEPSKLDRLADLVSGRREVGPELLTEAGFDPEKRIYRLLFEYTRQILDFPRHLSIHPGGFLLGQNRIDRIVPIENASMDERTVIQWDKYHLEELGLVKVDLLGLGALTQLHDCFDLIEKHHDTHLSLASIPSGDEATYEMMCEADTIGVFQIESRAQMSMLPRLKPKNYYDLVVEISLVRPGPITGEMVHPYLRRREGTEKITYPHPSLKPVLEKTLGVPLFQEQVMKLAVIAADYTPGEADQLRRDMGFRSKNALEKHRDRMIPRMIEKGIDREYAERIFQQIQGFGSYGFPESHAASFALISYATAYLRCHYLPAFVCSLLNAQPMGFYSVSTVVEDAKRHGVDIEKIDINSSSWNCTLIPPSPSPCPSCMSIQMGARFVKGLAEAKWRHIARERNENGPYRSLEAFVDRTRVDEKTIDELIEAGAFDSLHSNRRQVLWRAKGLKNAPSCPLNVENATPGQTELAFAPLTDLERVKWDYRASRHTTGEHPLASVRHQMQRLGLPTAKQVHEMPNQSRTHYAGLVIVRQRPGTASGVCFVTFEDETGLVNALLWPHIADQYRVLLTTEAFVGVTGRIQREDDVLHIIADMLWRPDLNADPPEVDSHDFR